MAKFQMFFLVSALLISLVAGEAVRINSCADEKTNCVINEITVEPCPEAANNKPCKLKRGKSAKLSFNFTPGFDATTASSEAYWIGQLNEVPWAGMNTDACAMTTCPIQKGVNQTYSYELEVAKKYPAGHYNVKWKLWNE